MAVCLVDDHPRLYFTREDLPRLRALRAKGVHKLIWRNLKSSAEWCLGQPLRNEWIAPVSPDPCYLNLYDRFYALMHDMAVMEHLAFAYAYSGHDRYAERGKEWTLTCCRIWSREADGEPDMGKAYAVTRILKGIGLSYDILYEEFTSEERDEIKTMVEQVGHSYYKWYVDNPEMAGPEQNSHHGSVEASSFGVAALAFLEEIPEASDWLELMVEKHTGHLLENGLTFSGTSEYSANFWASTMHYRMFFLDPLRRVTGQDLFKEYEDFMPGRMGLAAIAGYHHLGHDESDQSVLIGPSYGQLNYWSPVMLFLAREYRRPIYQHLALWDKSLGAIPESRYVTPNGEKSLFEMGGYQYVWYDPTVKPGIEPNLPLSFEFADLKEAYFRDSYEYGGIVAGTRHGSIIVYAGDQSVLVVGYDTQIENKPLEKLGLVDEGRTAIIRCGPSETFGFSSQTIKLNRPGLLTLTQKRTQDLSWWCIGEPSRDGNTLTWPDGTVLRVTAGDITSYDKEGYCEDIRVGFGLLKMDDPTPVRRPLITVRPSSGLVQVEVRTSLKGDSHGRNR